MHQHPHRNEKEPAISDPRTNERIRVPEVRLVGPAGEQVGVVRVEDALRLAREAELDLVEVAPDSRPPVVKIMDFGKFKYEQAQKAKEARRNQANTVLKEVRFRLKIDEHDYETKRKRAEGFLQSGDKVKAMILFRGREQSRPEMGVKLLQRFSEDIREFGVVESTPTLDGRNMTMIVGPLRSKSDAKAEQNAQRGVQRQADQEKRRAEAERQAARQAAIEAERPARPTPTRTTTRPEPETTRAPRSSAPRATPPQSSPSRPRQAPRTVQPTPAGAPRPVPRSTPPEAPAGPGRPVSTPQPTGSPAAKPAGTPAAKPASSAVPKPASSAAPKPASSAAPKPAAPKPAAKPGAPKPGPKPADPSASE